MDFQFTNNLKVAVFQTLKEQSNLVHFITTREGGCSKPPYDSLNLSFNTLDDPSSVTNNRKRLARALGIEVGQLIFSRQVHGDTVIKINESFCHSTIKPPMESDALITNITSIAMGILIADCVPLLFHDPVNHAIGLAHAGWRGTVANIALKTILSMQKHFGTRPADLLAGIGPSIGPRHFEIGDTVAGEFKRAFQHCEGILYFNGHKIFCNLWHANKTRLLQAGVNEKNISVAKMCTFEQHDTFFSHRFNKGITGRMGAVMMLNKS